MAAYQTCVAAQTLSAKGLHLIPIKASPDDTINRVRVMFNTVSGDNGARTYNYSIIGATISNDDKTLLTSSHQGSVDKIIVIQRDSVDVDAYFRVYIESEPEDGDDDVLLRKRPRIYKRVAIRKSFRPQTWAGGNNTWISDTYKPDIANGFVIDTNSPVSFSVQIQGPVNSTPTQIEFVTPDSAKANAMYGVPKGFDAAAAFTWHGVEVKYEWKDVTDNPNELIGI